MYLAPLSGFKVIFLPLHDHDYVFHFHRASYIIYITHAQMLMSFKKNLVLTALILYVPDLRRCPLSLARAFRLFGRLSPCPRVLFASPRITIFGEFPDHDVTVLRRSLND